MTTTDTSEKGLEALIGKSLLTEAGYIKSLSGDYDRNYCLDKTQLLLFLRKTQPTQVTRLETSYGKRFEEKLFQRICDQIKTRGIVDVIRNGIKAGEVSLTLYYKLPSSQLNPQAIQRYNENIFSVTRQLYFSNDHKKRSLDMGIFINGLPLITFELKNNLTTQNVQDAIKQYKTDRDPKEPLFNFARCLVHFAVDDELVYMTTELKGQQTVFLPFNKGQKSEPHLLFPDSTGNPINPNGLKTDYLWKEIFSKTSLSNIIEKYAQLVEEKDEAKQKKRKLIFPRYHQLDLVRKLLADAKINGVGQHYLVQHSAGSGKSNSISWLSHQLVELTDTNDTNSIFDSIIVVTDRQVLDRQIRDNIKQFAQVKGVVEAITEGSKQLKEALEEGKKIIITTVFKFAYVVREIQSLSNKKFAIVIDEAHSSQSGSSAAKMSAALNKEAGEDEETTEDKILRIIEEQKLSPNASYFAFTATPKNKTLEAFGVQNPADDKYYPFHNYSMKQAIEEEFILDVLENYTTFTSYCKLHKKIEYDPQFDTKRAKKKLKQYVEGHPHAIRKKAEIMIDHFMQDVIGQLKINGQAKAMVVTNGIVSAIRYKLAFDAYLQEINAPYKTIVAFTGSKEVDGKKEDESSMNGFPGNDIPKNFKKTEYRFLIVADKYQTGFDEPLLHTMYVDKTLADIKAVQTLSRLNRAYKPDKKDTFILDFVNSADAIKEAFDPFYKTTILSEETDIDRLNDLQDALDGFQVYSEEQVNELMTRFINGAERDQLDPILNECKQNFINELDEEQQIDFKKKGKSFVRNYQFLVQINPFRNPYWESLKTFLKFLLAKLPNLNDTDLSKGILESVDIDSYRIERQTTLAIQLEGGSEIAPTPPDAPGGRYEAQLDVLSNIIQDFNDRFGNIQWTEKDKVRRFLFEELPAEVSKDEEYQNAKKYSDRQNARITFEKKLVDKFQEFIFDHTEAYRKFTEDPEFKVWLANTLFDNDYDQGAA
ncbi:MULTISPECIES: type I restriction endonuclease subunit R [Nostoc]|uniref:Type I restriction endonuclease subunit R n=2 Tax=Nostoc TaxID=1177 RepID=A0ABR8IKR5_9NOSO|nr:MULTISPECIES: type I restriction endonuclease [Nostoc]MBD2565242.1 type I restriction endonuclease subunit R [Nostoc linckia FACHB-391]MBD2650905.1 type I restriction endonuclease subunit R [Nostoc foliaceum FACHB-393]